MTGSFKKRGDYMQKCGIIVVKGIVQGVGFRPFVYSLAEKYNISGSVQNLGSEVRVVACGDNFDSFLSEIGKGTPLSKIDSVDVLDYSGAAVSGFYIDKSSTGTLSGFIPADVSICDDCIDDIRDKDGRYFSYWATSCVNCGPRYSIISDVPYDRERTTMDEFPLCAGCRKEYEDPLSRRHHAQTIACRNCGPGLFLYDRTGDPVDCPDPVKKAAELLDAGHIVAIRGIGGFHIACTESSAPCLKERLGRTEQALAIMAGRMSFIDSVAFVSDEEREILRGPEHPVVVLVKRERDSLCEVSNLDTIGIMLPYSGLHHLLFDNLKAPFLIMTSANSPGNPMITEYETALLKLRSSVDYLLTHNRVIKNRCDDSVVRDGYIIRMSRGYAPRRTSADLGGRCILAVGPELNSNITVYKGGFCYTSPHVGNVRNPSTLDYLKETVHKMTAITGAEYDIIAHDMHPQFLSTRYAKELSDISGAQLIPVQHHHAHIAAVCTKPCVGIAIDGVGLGDDGTVWGGEVFAGCVPELERVGHLETVDMPGGDLAAKFPERMLYGILPDDLTAGILAGRGMSELELNVLDRQVKAGINVAKTSSTGRVLDAASALLGICREKTYDGEPAMKLEASASAGTPAKWEREFKTESGCRVFKTSSLLRRARAEYLSGTDVSDIAASFQYNLAAGIAEIAAESAGILGYDKVAVSGGVAYNKMIRETVINIIRSHDLIPVLNRDFPLGDGCISYGQAVYAGKMKG